MYICPAGEAQKHGFSESFPGKIEVFQICGYPEDAVRSPPWRLRMLENEKVLPLFGAFPRTPAVENALSFSGLL
jgi:hypothetical protein